MGRTVSALEMKETGESFRNMMYVEGAKSILNGWEKEFVAPLANLGLVRRTNCRVPTARGWLVLLVAASALAWFGVHAMHPFLAVTHPVKAKILVLDAWLPDYALTRAITEFKEQGYSLMVATGGPLRVGTYLIEYRTEAEVKAAILKRLGFDERLLVAVPAEAVAKDRTYASALALKKWIRDAGLPATSMNIYSFGVHARRSWLLFQEAFGDEMEIGVIAAEDRSYDARHWWKSSRGVKAVGGEMIAYCYTRLFFYPSR